MNEGADARILATILASCRVTLTIYSVAGDKDLVAEVLVDVGAEPGPFEQRIAAHRLADANSLLLTANEEEYHLYPFSSVSLGPAAK